MEDEHDNFDDLNDFEDSGNAFDPELCKLEDSSASNDSFREAQKENLQTDENQRRNEKLLQDRANYKGQPKKGKRTKYPGQTYKTRKALKDSNQ